MLAAFGDRAFLSSLALTVAAATTAALAAILLGAPAAYALSRSALKPGLRATAEATIASPIGVPHIVVGLAILLTFSPSSPLGGTLGHARVVGTFFVVVLAFFVVSAPLAVSVLKASFDRADLPTELAARSLGASPSLVFFRIVVPRQVPALAEAFLVAWGRSVSEFGSVAILAYFVFDPPLFPNVSPASVFVWNEYQISGLFDALKYAGALLLVSLVPLASVPLIRRASR
ncbi:MAG: ABC transporter permease [Thermoplasmatota archaeon]